MKTQDKLAWDKVGGVMPAIVQDSQTQAVLMLGYMDRAALQQTLASGRVTFFSRTRQRLWQKGEQSGHHLHVISVQTDCDYDTLLVQATPAGPTCHLGTPTCFVSYLASPIAVQAVQPAWAGVSWLTDLIRFIAKRDQEKQDTAQVDSYTASLLRAPVTRVAQKVGEEGVEVALAAATNSDTFIEEAADLLFHLLVLLQRKQRGFSEVIACMQARHKEKTDQDPQGP